MSGEFVANLCASITAVLGALGVFFIQVGKIIPDNKKRRADSCSEHAIQTELLKEIRAAQKKEVRDLKKRVAELEMRLAEAAQAKINNMRGGEQNGEQKAHDAAPRA